MRLNGFIFIPSYSDFQNGWFAHPIFSAEGNYPAVMISQIGNNSLHEGRPESRLPTFSKEWIDKIRGSADFFGINYYTSRFAEAITEPVGRNPSFERDRNFKNIFLNRPEFKSSILWWFKSYPRGLGDLLR